MQQSCLAETFPLLREQARAQHPNCPSPVKWGENKKRSAKPKLLEIFPSGLAASRSPGQQDSVTWCRKGTNPIVLLRINDFRKK